MKFPRISLFEAILGFFSRFSFVDFGYVGQSYGVALGTPCSKVFVF